MNESENPAEILPDPGAEQASQTDQAQDLLLDLEIESEEETIAVELEAITVQDFQAGVADICATSLFGSFLLCGTLIGLALLRKIYGT